MRTSGRLWCAAFGAAAVMALLSCGEDSEESSGTTTTTAQDGCEGATLCDADCTVNGIQGRVVVPSCAESVSFANVTLLDELGMELATAEADARGEFAIAAPSDGTFILRAVKGPYRTANPSPFTVSGGVGQFQIVVVGNQ